MEARRNVQIDPILAQQFLNLPPEDSILLNNPVVAEEKPIVIEEQNFQNVTSDFVIDNIQDYRVDRYFRILNPYIKEAVSSYKRHDMNLKFKIIITSEFSTPLAFDIIEAHFNRPFEDTLAMNNFPLSSVQSKKNSEIG